MAATRKKSETAPPETAGQGGGGTESAQDDGQRPPRRLPIVGIGASAGGIEAIETFLDHLPEGSGMAFVIVVHLSHSHASILPELIQRNTALQVRQIENGMTVAPDTIYVIPPNRDLAILRGTLQLTEMAVRAGVQLPIDGFFRSLAQDQGENAIGIILSGTGTDGTLGLKEIKGEGGMTMVQEEESAKYDSMPRSAIATGMIDFILPPERMPEQLINYTRHTARKPATGATLADRKFQECLQKIILLLRTHVNHDFSLYKQNTIIRRIERRMHVHQIDEVEDYLRYLKQHEREVRILFKDLLIGVTNFFRDPEAFVALKEKVFKKQLKKRAEGRDFRVWVPGCSTGEEAYSIAILLHECQEELNTQYNVQVFATDIDEEAINTAREGLYPASISADVGSERLKRFFLHEDSHFRIKKLIREMLVFAPQNLVKDPPFTKLDLISCRNLLIYLNTETQRKLLPVFHYSLKAGGFLFLGSSESVGQASDLFQTVDRKWKIFSRQPKEAVHPVVLDFSDNSRDEFRSREAQGKPEPVTQAEEHHALQMVEMILQKSEMPPCTVIDDKGEILYVHGHTGRYLELPTGRTRINILDMARFGIKHELSAAIRAAAGKKAEQTIKGLHLHAQDQEVLLDITVQPIIEPVELRGLMLVVFNENPPPDKTKQKGGKGAAVKRRKSTEELEKELLHTKEYLQTTIEELEASNEELKSTNEELQSTNEELQSTNEELETSKEELQSLNEESATVNTELQNRIDELAKTNDDLKNLLDTSQVSTIFLDTDLRIRRFTAQATEVVKLVPADIGRPISHFALNLKEVDLERLADEVLRTLEKREVEARTNDGRIFMVRIIPYRTVNNVIDGVVVTLQDISRQKGLELELRQAQLVCENLLDLVQGPYLVLDGEFRVITANRSFFERFGGNDQRLLGERLFAAGRKKERASALRERLTAFVGQTERRSALRPSGRGSPPLSARPRAPPNVLR